MIRHGNGMKQHKTVQNSNFKMEKEYMKLTDSMMHSVHENIAPTMAKFLA